MASTTSTPLVTPAMLQAGNAVTLGDRDSGPITLTWDELTRIYCAMQAAAAPVAPRTAPADELGIYCAMRAVSDDAQQED